MTVRELAIVFGISVNELAKEVGCTRQHLYNLIEGDGSKTSKAGFLHKLKSASEIKYENDLTKADMQKKCRDDVLKELEEKLVEKEEK